MDSGIQTASSPHDVPESMAVGTGQRRMQVHVQAQVKSWEPPSGTREVEAVLVAASTVVVVVVVVVVVRMGMWDPPQEPLTVMRPVGGAGLGI